MKDTSPALRSHERWAHFRFSVIGPLLAAPPSRGQLQGQLQALAAQKWRHPLSGEWIRLGFSTLERWYYKALCAQAGPVEALKRKIRSDHGQHPAFSPTFTQLLAQQFRQHPSWSYRLHADNLAILVEQQPHAGPLPSYGAILRYMKSHGLFKRPRRGPVHSPGAQAAECRYEAREVRNILIGYLRKARAQSVHRHLFLRIKAPRSPMQPTAVREVLAYRIRQSGLNLKPCGTHVLRQNAECRKMPSEAHGSREFLGDSSVLGLATRHFSEALQEHQELVPWAVAAWLAFQRIGFGQRLLFEREICMKIDLGCFHRFMP